MNAWPFEVWRGEPLPEFGLNECWYIEWNGVVQYLDDMSDENWIELLEIEWDWWIREND